MENINQLLAQAQTAYDLSNWSLLTQYLQQLILTENLEISQYQEYLLQLALSVLEFGDFQQRWGIAQVFVAFGPVAIPCLIEILEDEETEEELRCFAARILGDLQHPDAIEPLVNLLQTSNNEENKAIAATALGQMGTQAISALAQLVAQENTRLLAVRSLSHIRHPETITPLLSVVQDPQIAVRVTVVEALSSFHDQRVPPVLLAALSDVAASVRREAVLGLGYRPDLRAQLNLVPKLQAKLYDVSLDVCCAAATSLARMACDQAAQYLFQALISPHTVLKLQIEIIRALSWVGNLSSLEYLQQALSQLHSITLQQEIVTVLGRVQDETLTKKATEILLATLKAKHPAVESASIRSAIALSLGQLGRIEALASLVELSKDEATQVRLHALAALKKLAPEFAIGFNDQI